MQPVWEPITAANDRDHCAFHLIKGVFAGCKNCILAYETHQGKLPRTYALLPACVDDYPESDTIVWFIEVFVESLDLAAVGFDRALPKATGRPGYDPSDLLKLYIYGSLNRARQPVPEGQWRGSARGCCGPALLKIEDIQDYGAAGVAPYAPKPLRGSAVKNGVFTKEELHYDPDAEILIYPHRQLAPKYKRKIRDNAAVIFVNTKACKACILRARCSNAACRKVMRNANDGRPTGRTAPKSDRQL